MCEASVVSRVFVSRLSLCIILAIATTIAVAWLCAWIVELPPGDSNLGNRGILIVDSTQTMLEKRSAVGAARFLSMGEWYGIKTVAMESGGPGTGASPEQRTYAPSFADGEKMLPPFGRKHYRKGVYLLDARGWPSFAMWCRFEKKRGWETDSANGGMQLAGRPDAWGVAALPLKILWIGFISNTVLAVPVWLVLLQSLAMLRHWLRRARGRCPECCYVLIDDRSGCPECGWHRQPEQSARDS
jgi:hypothetical protein